MNEFEEYIKKAMLKDGELREAFILEEMKPFFVQDGDIFIKNQQLRLRLAEIKDFKQKVKEAIDNFDMGKFKCTQCEPDDTICNDIEVHEIELKIRIKKELRLE